MKMNKKILPYLLSFFILILLFYNINLTRFMENLIKVDTVILLLTLPIFFLIKFINTVRYGYFYDIKDRLKLFFILCLSNLTLNILPFNLGEFSYIYQFKKYFGISSLKSIPRLVLIRAADLFVLYIIFLFSSIYVFFIFKNTITSLISLIFLIFLILLLFFAFLVFKFRDYKIKNRFIKKFQIYAVEMLNEIGVTKLKEIFRLLIITFLYWTLRFLFGYFVLIFLGMNLSLFVVIFISAFLILLNLLPLKTLFGFGIFEFGWIYFLVQLGFDYSSTLPLLFIYHLVLIFPMIIFGLLSWICLILTKETNAPTQLI